MQTTMRRWSEITVVVLLQAGGHSQAGPAASAAAARPPAGAWVQLEGCLTDTWFTATEGRIDALNARGQLVASAQADSRGVFRLRVPVRATVLIRPAAATDEGLQVTVGESNLRLGACLIDFGPR